MLTVKLLAYLIVIVGCSGIFFLKALRLEDRRLLGTKPLLFMIFLLAASLAAPNAPILLAVIVIALPVLARSRMDAVVLFIVGFLILPEIPYRIEVGSLYLVPADAENAFALGLALACLTNRRPDTPLGRLRYYDIAFIAFFVPFFWTELHGRTAGDFARQTAVALITYVVPYLCISRSIRSEIDLKRLLLAFTLVGFCLAVDGVYEARSHWPILSLIEGHLHVATRDYWLLTMKVRGGLMRASGSFFESLSFATFLTINLIATLAIRRSFASSWQRYAVLLCVAGGLFVTGSRGGVLAALIGVSVYDLYCRRYAALSAKLAVFGAGGLIVALAAQSSERLRDRLGFSGNSLDTGLYRQRLLERGLDEFRSAPLFGHSANQIFFDLRDLRQGEGLVDIVNVWLFLLMALGAVGTAVVLVGTFLPVTTLFAAKYRRRQSLAMQSIQGFVVATTIAFAFMLTGTSWSDRSGVVWMMSLAVFAPIVPMRRKIASSPISETRLNDPVPTALAA